MTLEIICSWAECSALDLCAEMYVSSNKIAAF